MALEDTIKQLADSGKLSHLTIHRTEPQKTYVATCSLAPEWGFGHYLDADPLKAVQGAIDNAPREAPKSPIKGVTRGVSA